MANIKRLGQALRVVGDEIQKYETRELNQMEVLEQIYQQVYQQVCAFCSRQELCWQEEKEYTYYAFAQACNNLERYGLQQENCFLARLEGRCAKTEALKIALWNQMIWYQREDKYYRQHLQEKRQIANQLIAIGEELLKEKKRKLFFSAKEQYQLLWGYAAIPKKGNAYSGDTWGIQELSNGRIIQILSDGMGSGKNAHVQSETTVRLLKTLLYSGLTISTALQVINLVLGSRFEGESFSTVDLAIWDGPKKELELIKYGATPSFLKRGKKVAVYGGASLPVGILPELAGSSELIELTEGDMLIMMSDGLYELNEPNVFQWEKVIASIPTEQPQLAAEYLLAIANSRSGKVAKDDLTILVSRLIES